MTKPSNSLIQDILNMKATNTKTASAVTGTSKMEKFASTLLKLAEEMEADEEKEMTEEEKAKAEEEAKAKAKAEAESKGEGEGSSDSQAEGIVEAALAELDNSKSAQARGGKNVANIDYTKLAQAIMKQAVDGTGVFGLDADLTASPVADPGVVATEAKAINDKNISSTNVTDTSMGVSGPTDPMFGQAPQSFGGDETPLTPGEIKSAMAKMSAADATMLFKLAQVGYDVTVDVLSDEVVEKQAMAMVTEKAARVKAAQAYNYLRSQGINPFGR